MFEWNRVPGFWGLPLVSTYCNREVAFPESFRPLWIALNWVKKKIILFFFIFALFLSSFLHIGLSFFSLCMWVWFVVNVRWLWNHRKRRRGGCSRRRNCWISPCKNSPRRRRCHPYWPVCDLVLRLFLIYLFRMQGGRVILLKLHSIFHFGNCDVWKSQ